MVSWHGWNTILYKVVSLLTTHSKNSEMANMVCFMSMRMAIKTIILYPIRNSTGISWPRIGFLLKKQKWNMRLKNGQASLLWSLIRKYWSTRHQPFNWQTVKQHASWPSMTQKPSYLRWIQRIWVKKLQVWQKVQLKVCIIYQSLWQELSFRMEWTEVKLLSMRFQSSQVALLQKKRLWQRYQSTLDHWQQ